MKDFTGKIAVITGGGAGIGRDLAYQLASQGCHVSICDASATNMAETKRLIEAASPPPGTKVTTHVADVSIEQQFVRFRDEVADQMGTDHIHLLINNAGVTGGASMIETSRAEWERTFDICWGGVYLGVRTFLPMLMRASDGYIANMSSVSGFWASVGPMQPHTAYSTAKFAVRGFTEALITDLRLNAPHIKCAVVIPGHIGTEIGANSRTMLQGTSDPNEIGANEIAAARRRMARAGVNAGAMSDEEVKGFVSAMGTAFRDNAPTTSARAATIILDGIRAGKWRILVGEDAVLLDQRVRAEPERAYDVDFNGPPGVTRALVGRR